MGDTRARRVGQAPPRIWLIKMHTYELLATTRTTHGR